VEGSRELEKQLHSPTDRIGLKNSVAQVVERQLSGGEEEGSRELEK
jgi:hypothetical protein